MLKVLRTSRAVEPAVMRMKLDDMDTVADLAQRRRELHMLREKFNSSKALYIATAASREAAFLCGGAQETEDDESGVLLFAALRQAGTAYFERELAAIEAELRKLGVEP
jgi:hypothetical protein